MGRFFKLPVLSWIVYDFANTIFSYTVITRYFTEWVVIEHGQADWKIGAMNLFVSLVLLISLPIFGEMADLKGQRKIYLIVFTLISISATFLLGLVDNINFALLIAAVAIYGFNSALAHYDPLLTSLELEKEDQAKVSGFGVAAGYLGVVGAIILLNEVVDGSNREAFIPTALMFFVFSLPIFFFVKNPKNLKAQLENNREIIKRVFKDLFHLIKRTKDSHYGRFLVARFLYVDAIATVMSFMSVYARRTTDFGADETTLFFIISIVFAVIGALLTGAFVNRLGPKTFLRITITVLAGALLLAAVTTSDLIFWFTGPILGLTLGTVWSADRVLLIRLTHEDERGQAFGLYTLTGKISSGLAPFLIWGGSVFILYEATHLLTQEGASRAAIIILALVALLGVFVLRKVPQNINSL